MSRTLTKQSVKPVVSYVKQLNSGFYNFYHFTLDTYNDHNSFTGGNAYDLDGCYSVNTGKPFDEYALSLETGVVYRLSDKAPVMTVNFKTNEVTV